VLCVCERQREREREIALSGYSATRPCVTDRCQVLFTCVCGHTWRGRECVCVCVCVCVCTSVAALGVDRAPVELVAWCLRIAEPPDF
jgi:hypothetical protein